MGAILLPALARAAAYGSFLGLGGELIHGKSKGTILIACVVASVALRAIAYYFGAWAAIGLCLGASMLYIIQPREFVYHEILGGALIGGTLGYLAEIACIAANLTFVVAL